MKASASLILAALLGISNLTVARAALEFELTLLAPDGVDPPSLSKSGLYAELSPDDGKGPRVGLQHVVKEKAAIIQVPDSRLEAGKSYKLVVTVERQPAFPFAGELVQSVSKASKGGKLELKLKNLELVQRRYRLVDAEGRAVKNQPLAMMQMGEESAFQVAEAKTNESGHFQFSTWSDRTYEIESKVGGPVELFQSIKVPALSEGPGVVEVHFGASNALAAGKIELLADKNRLELAQEFNGAVHISREGVDAVRIVPVRKGRFEVPKLPPGKYHMALSALVPYKIVRGATLVLEPHRKPDNVSLVIAPRPERQLDLFVGMQDKTPLVLAKVEVLDQGTVVSRGRTGQEGRLSLKLYEGEYRVRVSHPSFTRVSKPVELQDKVTKCEALLAAKVTLELLVTDPDGATAPNVVVAVVQGDGEDRRELSAETDANGRATVVNLDAGSAVATVVSEKYPRAMRAIELPGDRPYRIALRAGTVVSGRVALNAWANHECSLVLVDPKLGLIAGGSAIAQDGKFRAIMGDGDFDAYVQADGKFAPVGKLTVGRDPVNVDYAIDQAAVDSAKSPSEVFRRN